VGFGRWYRTWAIEFASNETVYWNYDGNRIELNDLPARAFDAGSPAESDALRDRTAALLDEYNETTAISASVDDRFAALADERIHAHPILYHFGLPAARLLDMILRPRTEMMDIDLEWWKWRKHPAQTVFAGSYAVLNLAYFALGVGGLAAWKHRRWTSPGSASQPYRELAFAMAASLILRCALLLTLDNAEPRYTLEFFPVLLVWAGALFATSPGTAAEQSG
jgi:hypothetical protein